MAAPDRVYRFFTNLILKEYSIDTSYPLVIRGAKPLAAYVTSNTTYPLQLEELKEKFKIDGILWLKNPDEPFTSNDDPNTVTIDDPSSSTTPPAQITIEDPDLDDQDRSAFIAYVFEGSDNSAFHDIRETISNQSSVATDYSSRSWSRLSKLRIKVNESDTIKTGLILNDAGLNRLADCEIAENGISKYIDNSSLGEITRFNDIQVLSNFYSTPYNKINHSCLEMRPGTGIWSQVADFGYIGALGPSGDTTTPYTVRFVGRKAPSGTDTYPVCEINYPSNSNFPAITVSGANVASEIHISIPQYSFRLSVENEEGKRVSDAVTGIDMGLYRWNKDDDMSYGTLANNADTDRVSISHFNSNAANDNQYNHLEPETSVARYNAKQGATENQIDPMDTQNIPDSDGLIDPDPNSTKPVLLLYTPTSDFSWTRNPFGGNDAISISELQFFIDEDATNEALVYYPFIPGMYNFTNQLTSNYSASYLTMKCKVNGEEGVYCLEYQMSLTDSTHPNNVFKPVISRYWKLEYNGTSWVWPKSEYNKNVSMSIIYANPSDTSVIPRGTDLLALNTVYGINLLISNINEGQQISHISISTSTKNAAILTDSSGSEAGTTNGGVQTVDITDPQISTGKVGWCLRNIGYIKRTNSTITTQSIVTVTITYKTYAGMWYGDNGTNKNLPIDKKTIGDRNNISGFLYFNYKSKYTTYTYGDHVNPNTIYADALVSGHEPTALNQGNDVLFFIGSGEDSTSGVLYTDYTTSSIVSQGYYFNNYQPSLNVSDGIYYVDDSGLVSRVYNS